MIDFNKLPPLQDKEFDPRFSYKFSDWMTQTPTEDEEGNLYEWYMAFCEGYWEDVKKVDCPCIYTAKDIAKNPSAQGIANLLYSIYKNAIPLVYEATLEKVEDEERGLISSLHPSS